MKLTFFNDVLATNAQEYDVTWEQLALATLSPTEYHDKQTCPLIKLASLGDNPDNKKCLRYDNNIEEVWGVEGDYDAGIISPEIAALKLIEHGIQGVIYTTPSHTEEHPRWRVIAPFEKAHHPSERRDYAARLNGAMGGILANESFTLSQAFYFGKINGSHDYKSHVISGQPLDTIIQLKPVYPAGVKPLSDVTYNKEPVEMTDQLFKELQSALKCVSTDDYHTRIAVGQALSQLGVMGKYLYVEWHMEANREFKHDSLSKWDTFDGSRTGYQSIFSKALTNGWNAKTVDTKKYQFGANFDISKGNKFKNASITGRLKELKAELKEQTFVLGELALRGQSTIFYAPPNTGKTLITLKLLMEAIEDGLINGEDVVYINSDDDITGVVSKAELLEPYGVQCLANGFNGFDNEYLIDWIADSCTNGTAKDTILILDTLTHFTDVMSNAECTAFFREVTKFTLNGGTVIVLAHTNKNRDSSGKLVHGGVQASSNLISCSYVIDFSEDPINETKTAVYNNTKVRGKNAKTAAYKYTTEQGASYEAKLASVRPCAAPSDLVGAVTDTKEDIEITAAIENHISKGIADVTLLIDSVNRTSGHSKAKIRNILTKKTGTNYKAGDRWHYNSTGYNGLTKTYYLLSSEGM